MSMDRGRSIRTNENCTVAFRHGLESGKATESLRGLKIGEWPTHFCDWVIRSWTFWEPSAFHRLLDSTPMRRLWRSWRQISFCDQVLGTWLIAGIGASHFRTGERPRLRSDC